MSVYNKRSSSEALGASSQQDTFKKMRVTSPSQVVDLEEEEQKGKTCMEMVDTTTNNDETNTETKPQNERNTEVSAVGNTYSARHLGKFINPRKI
jgi:hypothetical protein